MKYTVKRYSEGKLSLELWQVLTVNVDGYFNAIHALFICCYFTLFIKTEYKCPIVDSLIFNWSLY